MNSKNTYHVVTTINEPTAITCTAKSRFLDPEYDNLIICKGSTIEIYSILSDGIKLATDFSIYGVISKIQACTIPNKSTCSLFVLTDQNYFTILTYDSVMQRINSEGHGKLSEPNARITDQPISIVIDLKSSTILISAFTGRLFSVPLAPKIDVKGKSKEAVRSTPFEPSSIRTNEFDFISMVSLKGIHQSSIAVLLGGIDNLKTIKTFKYNALLNEISENDKLQVGVEATTHSLVAVPDPIGGVLSIGEYIISYYDLLSPGSTPKELSIDPTVVMATSFLENSYDHCMIGDAEGYLYMLTFDINNLKVHQIHSTLIGQACIPNSITDLGNDLFYIGSSQGDPCVIRLNRLGAKFSVDILHTFSNLGPIVDFCLFDYDQQGKQTMVCCSGVDKDGSLRVVENGIGFLEEYELNIPLITQVFPLIIPGRTSDTLIISTFDRTIVLNQTSDTEMKEYNKYGALIHNDITLATTVNHQGHLVQITKLSARIMTLGSQGTLLHEWRPPKGEYIAIAQVNATQCVLCCGKGLLIYLDYAGNAFRQISCLQLPDVACIRLCPLKEDGLDNDYVLVGMWSKPKAMLLLLPTLETILEYPVKETGPRDLLITRFEQKLYFMVLLGDGQLFSNEIQFRRNVALLMNERQTMVGTYCTAMYPYVHQEQKKVFIAGSRPTIVSSLRQTLFFSAVNMKDIFAFATFNQHILLMTSQSLLFGQIDASQKLHHNKFKIENDMPVRIRYMNQARALAVGTIYKEKNNHNGFLSSKGNIRILDAQTFQVLDTYALPETETIESMVMASFSGYPNKEYLFVGTIIENLEDPDANHGRILVFDIKDNYKVELLEAVEQPGVIYDLKAFQNSVVAAVNGSIYCLTKFAPDLPVGQRLSFEINVHKNVLALGLDTRGDKVLVGDLMQSMSVLKMTSQDPLKLDVLAVDSKPVWMTAVKFVNDYTYIGADDRNNIFTLALDQNENNEGNISKLQLKGGFHVGSLINCFRPDTLVDVLSTGIKDKDALTKCTAKSFTFATVHGSIGTVKTISQKSFEMFNVLQQYILLENTNVGNLKYSSWRNYKPKLQQMYHQQEITTYLDGDLLKKFQCLTYTAKYKILQQHELLRRYSIIEMEGLINSLIS
ncbi:CPSF A subunit region-domain-containing protein [Parasitella parasitica]|nr:CPSF A subunit region-domain-containing protein [Parasitella parasitica]